MGKKVGLQEKYCLKNEKRTKKCIFFYLKEQIFDL